MDAAQDPAATGTQATDTTTAGAGATAEKMLPQSQVTALMARAEGKLKAERDAMAKELDELKVARDAMAAEKLAAEEAKLSQAERAKLERAREVEGYAKQIAELTGRAEGERARRHTTMLDHAAAQYAGGIAGKILNADLLPHAERAIRTALVIEVDAAGAERVALRLGASPADTEPLGAESFKKFSGLHLTGFLATAGGSGARHGAGAGNGGGRASWGALSPVDKLKVGLGG